MPSKCKAEVVRVGKRSDFSYEIEGVGIVVVPKGIVYNSSCNHWQLNIHGQYITYRAVYNGDHCKAIRELVKVWKENFRSTIADPDCGMMHAHAAYGLEPRSKTGVGGVYEIRRNDEVIALKVTMADTREQVYLSIRDYGRYDYALALAENMRDRSLRRNQIRCKYRGLFTTIRERDAK